MRLTLTAADAAAAGVAVQNELAPTRWESSENTRDWRDNAREASVSNFVWVQVEETRASCGSSPEQKGVLSQCHIVVSPSRRILIFNIEDTILRQLRVVKEQVPAYLRWGSSFQISRARLYLAALDKAQQRAAS